MKILFIQRMPFLNVGTMLLSAVLRQSGHDTKILIAGQSSPATRRKAVAEADLLGFYCVSGAQEWITRFLRDYPGHPPLVLGGPHPTFKPDVLLESPADFSIRGEAVEALPELASALSGGGPADPSSIRSLCYISGGELRVNEQRELVQDLDSLPFQDPGPYMEYPFLRDFLREFYPVITSRGCPFRCTFCFNRIYKDLYRGKGRFTRRRSPENVIEELKRVVREYRVRNIVFEDDSFVVDPDWLRSCSDLYSAEIGLPFVCQTPAASLTPETVELLANMNCSCVRIGIETANEETRRKILGKGVANEQIAAAASLLKKHNIMILTYNMAGIPGETFEDTLNTMMFNRKIGADFTWVSFLQYYPGTELYERAREENGGDVPHDVADSLFDPAALTDRRMANIGMLMQFFNTVRMPPQAARLLASLPLTPLYRLIQKAFYALSMKKIYRLSWPSFVEFSLRMRKYFGSTK